MANSISDLQKRLEAVNKVRMNTRIQSEFKSATREARNLERQIARLDNQGKGGFFSKIKGFAMDAAAPLLGMASAAAITAFVGSSIGAAMNFEKTNKSFEVLSGSKARGNALSGELLDLKQNTMLGASVYQNAQTLMGFGVSDKEVTKDLKMIGDVAMGDADRMQSLTLAFAQTRAAGRLMGQDLLQYINAGFNPLGVISENWQQFGLKQKMSVGQLKEWMEQGKITSGAITKAFEVATGKGGRFFNMMDQLAETNAGKLQLLKGKYAAFQISVGQGFAPLTRFALEAGIALLKFMTHSESVSTSVTRQINQIRALQLELTSSNTSESRRLEILKQLTDINPNITKGIKAEAIEYSKLASNINDVVTALGQKQIASSLEEKNAKTITKYNRAVATSGETNAAVFALLAQINPDLAERTDMSAGQKQLTAIQYLRAKIKNNPQKTSSTTVSAYGGAYTTNSSVEQDQLNSLLGLIHANQDANKIAKQLQPEVSNVKRQISAATNAYNQMFGVNTTAGGQAAPVDTGGGTGGGTGGSTDTGDLFSGGKDKINKGGQRSIVINIGKQIEHLDIHVMGKEEAGQEIARAVREEMVRVFNSLSSNNNGGI
ncbi:hypothetical protein F0L74_05910 [Chitinophaga agrisoli]|uniref:Tape measure protein N-terminal domain-containing protein n=1 Tax=Chitinophaga agrisoli TaxID=2607653 RepID=A0A5B2W1F7_9BACT|nr:tape measure protein [Chitinophaga agrisoli]KAA2245491.1 hypothetical protein F0L74_05910 [Chitinophaga agrisoli]